MLLSFTKKGRIAFLLMLCAICGCKKQQPISNAAYNFDRSYSISAGFDDTTSELAVHVKLDDDLHAYAEGEKVGKAVRIDIMPKNGWAADGPAIIPKGTKKKLNGLGESIILQGDFNIRQKLKPGRDGGEALLHLQVCTDNVCDRPRTHTLTFERPKMIYGDPVKK